MYGIVPILAMFVALDHPAAAAQEDATNTEARGYEVRFASGPKRDPSETPGVEIAYTATGQVAKVALGSDVDSIDEAHCAGNRCIILTSLMSNAGKSVYVVDAKSAEIVTSSWCFRPVVSPTKDCVVFEKWNPKLTPNDQIWPAVLVVSAPHADAGPVQVYPYESLNRLDSGGDRHSVVSPMSWSSGGDALAFFDKFGDYAGWGSPYELYVVLVRFRDGKPLRAKRSLVNVHGFVRTGADTKQIAFFVKSLEILDGTLRGKLYPQSYWLRDDFCFDLSLIDKEQTLSVNDITDPGPAAAAK